MGNVARSNFNTLNFGTCGRMYFLLLSIFIISTSFNNLFYSFNNGSSIIHRVSTLPVCNVDNFALLPCLNTSVTTLRGHNFFGVMYKKFFGEKRQIRQHSTLFYFLRHLSTSLPLVLIIIIPKIGRKVKPFCEVPQFRIF
jgi:hypothetical protein